MKPHTTHDLTLQRSDLIRGDNFVGGAWRPAASGQHFDFLDPTDLRAQAQVPDSGAAEAQAAVAAAHAASPAWRAMPAIQRAQLLRRWHALIQARATDLGKIISREQGKPLVEGLGKVKYAASYVHWFAEEAVRIHGDAAASISFVPLHNTATPPCRFH